MQVTGVKHWILGYRSVGQSKFVARLRRGASPQLATLDRCREWMRGQVGAEDRWAICAAVSLKAANGAGEYAAAGDAAARPSGAGRRTDEQSFRFVDHGAGRRGAGPESKDAGALPGGRAAARGSGRSGAGCATCPWTWSAG